MTLTYIILANLVVSLGAIIGILTLTLNKDRLNSILRLLISLSAGTLLGTTFFHLLPEAAEIFQNTTYLNWVLGSFIGFFLVEKILHWRHCHTQECDQHSFGYMNLVGDAIHNFTDGMIIAGTFLIDTSLGITTTLAIAAHEIPQEIGDFAVLLYSGFSKKTAFLANLGVALISVIGGIVGYYLAADTQQISQYLIPLAAGGFLYISTSDLIPEIRQEEDPKKMVTAFIMFLTGLALVWLLNSNH